MDPTTDDRAADPDADPYSVAKAIALRQLTMGPRSRHQLRQAMDRRLVPPDVAEQVLDRLEEVRLVDDEAFAHGYVRYRQRERGLAPRALASELRTKGVDSETVAVALEQVDPEDERRAAEELVRRRLPATRGLDQRVRVRRLAAMLARKGYSGELSMSVIRHAVESETGQLEELATEHEDRDDPAEWPG
ncbi:MAG: regulatory protein RecX [Actinomycetes bacterium]